jgi:hypothetical protein
VLGKNLVQVGFAGQRTQRTPHVVALFQELRHAVHGDEAGSARYENGAGGDGIGHRYFLVDNVQDFSQSACQPSLADWLKS